jgi:allantoate deiminase
MPIDAHRIMRRADALARCSELPDGLTRVCLSSEMRAAYDLVRDWMTEAGMTVRVDAIGNVIGRYEGDRPGAPCLLTGSHLDTVRNAGRYDGMLGVITPIECVHALHTAGRRLPFAIEVVGFCDEEGVRFATTFLGSRAIAGTFDPKALDAKDRDGRTMREAIRDFGLDPEAIPSAAKRRGDVLAFVELHIEQGPVLEAEELAVGTVTAINGFTRLAARIRGTAGHAGTVPMHLRKDALAAAAECVLAVERIAQTDRHLVGTVGRIDALPGAINVIPGSVQFTVDVRAPVDALRERARDEIIAAIDGIAARRGLEASVEITQEAGVAACAPHLMEQLDRAIAAEGMRPMRLPSGAGHDGMAIRALTDICMLFVRCKAGISHNPAEAITVEDADAGARVLGRFIENFRPQA